MASIKITKNMARDAGIRIATAEFKERIETARKKRDEYIDALVKTVCPNPIVQLANEYHSYFYCSDFVDIRNPEGYSETHKIKFKVPYRTVIDVSREAYDQARKLQRNVAMEYERRREAQDRWMNIILGIGTLKRMQEELPEAVEYVTGPTVKALPSVQYEDSRLTLQKIKKQKQNAD